MKAITLTQPWATLVAIGAKRIETRSWSTAYRGPLAIHAAKGLGPVGGMSGLWDLCESEPFHSVLRGQDLPMMLPKGAIVATCELVGIAEIMTDCLWETVNGKLLKGGRMPLPDEPERSFGDYTPFGRYAWLLTNIKRLPEPIPAKGALSLWEPDTLAQLAIKRQQIQAVTL